jgi:hypothetical protein
VRSDQLGAGLTDVRQDFDIWNHKTYLEWPALADGPVGLYRRWARQFHA